ncbi:MULTISPECIES: alpha/beta fold hydrolase [unclassified Saccharopolyspora]|uniref:alpha/beta fold hydrolase n=1 Tax=unclassified Saccharopolyspora TaxID=2646250 RepID=UPI001CD60163|nr:MULTISPECIES: alpha/beta fold hydrolase [unclassified Saccharopolyspora]MCA1185116.1 alpha/beta hydrolase [Saccharopolyspora sp. 6T]MCA1224991.1 alpha/beta hydrolase [Saccharopolyspora sp. 6M]MCA1278518.1 alpha/beta hydrolase [Saccharopolyspora sp. 7B]
MAEQVVLLPGMLCDAGLWSAIESEVDAPVLHPAPEASSITGMAEQVLSAVDGPFVLAGLSLGAIVGFEVARLAPERIAGFAALATNAAAPRPEQHQAWWRQAQRTQAGDFPAVVEEILPAMFAEPPPPEFARAFREMAARVGPRRFLTQLAAQATRADAHEVLPAITAPALVACGSADALCPPEFHRAIAARLPDAELHEVPGAGHLLPIEAPEVTAELLNRLLRRCRATSEENDVARSAEAAGAEAGGHRRLRLAGSGPRDHRGRPHPR